MSVDAEISELEGRELDAAVAREVFGAEVTWREEGGAEHPYADRTLWAKWCPTCGYDGHWSARAVPHFSTDIAAAWKVFAALPKPDKGQWSIVRPTRYRGWTVRDGIPGQVVGTISAVADTAPLAISRVALRAVRDE